MKNKFLLVAVLASVLTTKIYAQHGREQSFNNNNFSARAVSNNRAENNFHPQQNIANPRPVATFSSNENRVSENRMAYHAPINSVQATPANSFNNDENDRRHHGRNENGNGNNGWNHNYDGGENHGRNENSGHYNSGYNNYHHDYRGGENHYHSTVRTWINLGNGYHNHYSNFNGRQFYINYNCSIYPTFGYGIYAVDAQTFDDFMYALTNENYETNREEMAMDFVYNNYLNSNQVYAILQQFDFENNRLSIAKSAFRNVIDKQNYYEVFDEFSFDNSKYQLYETMNRGC